MRAAPSACPQHHPGGQAPDILRPSLGAGVRELCFEAFSVLHSGVSRTALAAAEHLTRRRIQRAREMERDDAFHAEDALPEEERARLSDYARSGFDRGHMAPSGDMPSASAQAESFSLANMVPQHPGSNRCLWEGIESTVRELAMEEGEVWVLTGPVFEGTTLQRLNGRVLVPTLLYKAIYLPGRGEAGVYLAHNAPGLAWRAVSLDGLREVAGLDAFPALPAAVKARAMELPEPRPSNIAGSCENQPRGTPPAAPPAPPERPAPSGNPSGGRIGLILGGVFALVMIVALVRVLGRR
ncbi:DNA/RNA non-specific endonuclease [Pararoseomonas sp. SCSIO 73927]|uniref:DNA/RNA non-specific endonuclease n=1 Tax=Pararoseomonas sp. SCSIO 73927 TaxID=3114537 RepID=UPI0030D09D56